MGKILESFQKIVGTAPKPALTANLDDAILAGDVGEIARHAAELGLDAHAVREIERVLSTILELRNAPTQQTALLLSLPHNRARRIAAQKADSDKFHSLERDARRYRRPDGTEGLLGIGNNGRLMTPDETENLMADHEEEKKRKAAEVVAEKKRRQKEYYEALKYDKGLSGISA